MIRVQIPAYCDAWMRGDRYGVVVKEDRKQKLAGGVFNFYTVKLDKSGKTIRVIADDCQEIA